MNLIQQLAEYQNAPIQTLEAAKKGANPAVSPWVAGAILDDRIEKQKRMGMAQGAAQGPQPTIDEQQDQELQGIMGLQGAPAAMASAPQEAAPQEAAPQEAAPEMPTMAAEGGLMSARVDPRMFDFSDGGIIAFARGGELATETSEGELADDELRVQRLRAEKERVEKEQRMRFLEGSAPEVAARLKAEEPKTDVRKQMTQAELAEASARAIASGNSSASPGPAPKPPAGPAAPRPAAPRPAAPSAGGIASLGAVQKAVTDSPEFKAMETARTQGFEAPDTPTTAGGRAAEREAHLKAQGITEKPWETASKQTAELRNLMKTEDDERARQNSEDADRKAYRRIVANMGAGSFGQAGSAGVRANMKYEDEMRAEEQRIKELRYNQKLKLNEIDAKAKELQYNEATGDVTAAQQNRAEIAKLKNEYKKNQTSIAKDMATLRGNAAAQDAQNATSIKTAGMRAAQGAGAGEKNDINALKARQTALTAELKTTYNKAERAEIRRKLSEIDTQLAQIAGMGGGAPVQSYGQPPKGAVREVKK